MAWLGTPRKTQVHLNSPDSPFKLDILYNWDFYFEICILSNFNLAKPTLSRDSARHARKRGLMQSIKKLVPKSLITMYWSVNRRPIGPPYRRAKGTPSASR